MTALVGIFVGGKGSRMGGVAKGLLPAPGQGKTLVQRQIEQIHSALPGAPIVLVGQHASYEGLCLPMLPDAAPDSGPLAGLVSLLEHAQRTDASQVYAVACDMPYVTDEALRILCNAQAAAVVAPCRDGRFEPLLARYAVPQVLPLARERLSRGELSLQGLLRALGAQVRTLELADQELRDWDTRQDIDADASPGAAGPGGPSRE